MKKQKTISVLLLVLLILFISIFFILKYLNILYTKNYNKFDYNEAKEYTIKYLNKNKNQLEIVVNELNKSKLSLKYPIKDISYASYNYLTDFDFDNKTEYIIFDLNSQGILGGQYYGLIYTKNNKLDLIIYDEYKETGTGNNIFIREKVKDNWYFYYDDFNGKVNINKIK